MLYLPCFHRKGTSGALSLSHAPSESLAFPAPCPTPCCGVRDSVRTLRPCAQPQSWSSLITVLLRWTQAAVWCLQLFRLFGKTGNDSVCFGMPQTYLSLLDPCRDLALKVGVTAGGPTTESSAHPLQSLLAFLPASQDLLFSGTLFLSEHILFSVFML